VVLAYTAAVSASNYQALCATVAPDAQSDCNKATAGAKPSGTKDTNIEIGYVAVEGNEALVGFTGTNCDPNDSPKCNTNSDPAAILSSGKPFDQLYSAAEASVVSTTTNGAYSLGPLIQVNGDWYLNIPDSYFTGSGSGNSGNSGSATTSGNTGSATTSGNTGNTGE